MAIAAALVTGMEGEDTGDLATYTTAAFTPAASTLYLLSVSTGKSTGASETPTVSGAGLTWVQVNTVLNQNVRTTVFRAMGSGSNGTLSIAHGGVNQNNCAWRLTSFTGTDISGTNGSGAIGQSKPGSGAGGTTSVSVDLDNAVAAGSATFGAFNQNSTSNAVTVGSGFTEVGTQGNTNPATPSTRLTNEYSLSGTDPVAFTKSSGLEWQIVAVEVLAAPVATPKSGSDTLNLNENETSTTTAINTGTDSLNLDENETASSFGTATATDTLNLDITETQESTSYLGAGYGGYEEGYQGGAANLAVTETSVVQVTVVGADTCNLDENETSQVVIATSITGAETVGLDANETSSVAISTVKTGADTCNLDANETQVSTGTLTGADPLGLDANETQVSTGTLTGADTLNLDASESGTLGAVTVVGADSLGLDENETSSLKICQHITYPATNVYPSDCTWPYDESETLITGSETLGLQISESGVLTVIGASQEYWGMVQI